MINHPCSSGQPDIGLRITHLLYNGKLPSYENFSLQWANYHLTVWEYLQLLHFIHSTQHTHNLSAPLTLFEKQCISSNPQSHVILSMHKLLWNNTKANEGKCCNAWAYTQKSLIPNGRKYTESSTKGPLQENNYKILSCWYRTPSLLHKLDRSIPDQCWRCQ